MAQLWNNNRKVLTVVLPAFGGQDMKKLYLLCILLYPMTVLLI